MEDAVVVIVAVIFSIGLLSMCVHCVRAQNAQSMRITRNRQPDAVAEGIDPEAINAFPVVRYSDVKDIKIGKGILECAVCLCEFSDDDLVRLLPECDHVFHPLCIDKWLTTHATCPICRTNLLQSTDSAVPADSGLNNDVAIHIDDDDDRRGSTANLISSEASSKGRHRQSLELHRSHSTGDWPVRRDEEFDKNALRLPEDVKMEILQGRHKVKQEEEEPSGVVLGCGYGEECSRMTYRSGVNDDEMCRILGRFDRFSKSGRCLRKTTSTGSQNQNGS